MEFKTTWAGQFNKVQLILMIVIETVYHVFCKQVVYHREIFQYKDGCEIALDWGCQMPKSLSEMKKNKTRRQN